MSTNYLKLTLISEPNGQETPRTYQMRVNARMSRTAYETYQKYREMTTKEVTRRGEKTREFTGLTQEAIELLVEWVVDAFGGQFAEEQFWDGYNASFMEIAEMLVEVMNATATALLEFPKQTEPEEKS